MCFTIVNFGKTAISFLSHTSCKSSRPRAARNLNYSLNVRDQFCHGHPCAVVRGEGWLLWAQYFTSTCPWLESQTYL